MSQSPSDFASGNATSSVAIYTRVSTSGREGGPVTTHEKQLATCRLHLARNGESGSALLQPVAVFQEFSQVGPES